LTKLLSLEARKIAALARSSAAPMRLAGIRSFIACRKAGRTSVQPNGRVCLDTCAALRASALADVGVAHLTRCSVQDDLDHGTLVQVLPSQRLPGLPLQSIHAFGRMLPARVRLLTDFVAAEMRELLRA